MINVSVADNFPVVHFGIKAYFKDHHEISIVSNVGSFFMVPDALKNEGVDVLLIDLELEGLKGINEIKSLVKNFPKTKVIIFSSLPEQIYAPNVVKAGCAGYVHKSSKLEYLGSMIVQASQGKIVLSDEIVKSLALIAKQNKNERLYRKLSNREVEVLRFLSDGKKNNEIAKILNLNDKTISTYKLRLLTKLNVTNLVDLVNKAKTLEIV